MAITRMNPTVGKVVAGLHRSLYKMSGGRIGSRVGKATVILLGTTGRRTGKQRETPLFAVPRADGWAITASNSGHDHAPDWYHNLTASPDATVRLGNKIVNVRARVAEGEERTALWNQLVTMYKDYKAYQEVTDRAIPVIVLEPASPKQ